MGSLPLAQLHVGMYLVHITELNIPIHILCTVICKEPAVLADEIFDTFMYMQSFLGGGYLQYVCISLLLPFQFWLVDFTLTPLIIFSLSSCCNTVDETSALSCFSAPDTVIGDYCPSPPKLNIDDYYSNSTLGPLDSYNTYIAEYLIRVAFDLQPSVFFYQVQAGFVVSYQEPALSFCGLSDPTTTREIITVLEAFYYDNNTECRSDIKSCIHSDFFSNCEAALKCVKNMSNTSLSVPGGYYSEFPYDFQRSLQGVCNFDTSYIAKTYPVQENTPSVTIWYNNQVR